MPPATPRRRRAPASTTCARPSAIIAHDARPGLASVIRSAEDVVHLALGHERLAPLERVVLAQRVPLELVVHEEAPQVGVVREADPVHVEAVALEPVGPAADGRDARHDGIRLRHLHPQANAPVVPRRVEVVDDLEARLARLLEAEQVDGRDVRQEVVAQVRLGLQEAKDVDQRVPAHPDRELPAVAAMAEQRVAGA